MPANSSNPETLVLHAGPRGDASTGAVAVPIYQTASYRIESTAPAADPPADQVWLGDLGTVYSRIANPTCDALEQRIAALEGGVAALAVGSGQAAAAMAVQNLCRPGDNIVSSADISVSTWSLLAHTLPSMGIEVRFVDPEDPDGFRRATDTRTRAYYGETLPAPKLTVFPIGEVAALGRALGVPLIVDNTAAPILCRPLEHGAAVVVHSAAEYICGHGTATGGIIVDGGKFDWTRHARRFPTLTEPDPCCHGAIWTEALRPLAPIAYIVRARAVLLRDIGAAMTPFNAFQLLQGLETLPLRMRQHCRNAAEVALYLQRHPTVSRVIYAGMHECAAHHRHAVACLKGGFGGLVGLELKGGREAGTRFIDALGMFCHVADIGHVRSLAVQPDAAASSGYVRLSVGIEHIDDIIADLEQALAAAAVPTARNAA
jgi:O-acetylhomoserine (thiol)-lyase